MRERNIFIEDCKNAVRGAWTLAQFNPQGLKYFDMTAEGYWKSFRAILVAAPLFLLVLLGDQRMLASSGLPDTLLPKMIGYFLHLPLSAFVMVYFTRYMKIDGNYAPLIIAYNWSMVITYLVTVPVYLLMMSGFVSQDTGLLMSLIVSGYIFMYRWFVFKVSLRISNWLAIGVLLFQQLFVLTVDVILIRLLSPEYFDLLNRSVNGGS